MQLIEFKNALSQAKNTQALNDVLQHFLADLHIKTFSFTYYAHHPKSNRKIKYDFASDTLKPWHDHYVEENYNEVDTTLDNVYQSNLPVFWSLTQQLKAAKNKREKQMRLDSIAYGAVKGISIPVHGPNDDFANLMVQQRKGETCLDDADNVQFDLLIAAHYYAEHIKKHLIKSQPAEAQYQLSEREMQCLTLLAKRYSVTQIAKALHITERTVNFHIQNINKKLGTKNKYESLAKALEGGLLTL